MDRQNEVRITERKKEEKKKKIIIKLTKVNKNTI